jgi:hypothetical protein
MELKFGGVIYKSHESETSENKDKTRRQQETPETNGGKIPKVNQIRRKAVKVKLCIRFFTFNMILS